MNTELEKIDNDLVESRNTAMQNFEQAEYFEPVNFITVEKWGIEFYNESLNFKQKLRLNKNKKYKLIWNGSNGYVTRKQKDFEWLLKILKMDFPGLKMPSLSHKNAKTLKVY